MLNNLIDEWAGWCKENNLPHVSADELLLEDIDLTKVQRGYIRKFISTWDEWSGGYGKGSI